MTEYLQGVDISHHQGDVNHKEVAEYGMLFCICKATEGQDYVDPRFRENIEKILAVMESGLTYFPGAYHFARPDSIGGYDDGRAEAEDFCDAVLSVLTLDQVKNNFMPPALDFEKYSESDGQENIPWINGWIEVVEGRLERRPMIYTGANVWRYEVSNTDEFIDYPLWQVYYSGTASSPPEMPWPSWTMWQWSGGNKAQHHPEVPGVGVVDVNRWHGSLDELMRFANASGCEPDPPEPPPSDRSWPSPPEVIDLNSFRGKYSEYVARVQGLLLSHDYGPNGLVGSDGKPDGLMGDKTETYIKSFKTARCLPNDAVMDWATWWAMAYDKLK